MPNSFRSTDRNRKILDSRINPIRYFIMNEKANIRIYIGLLMEFIRFNKSQIEEYKKYGYPEDHPEIALNKYLIESYQKRIRESQLELEIMTEKGKW